MGGLARRRGEVAAALDHGGQVLGGGAAAAADDRHAQVGDEPGVVLGQLVGREVVVHLAVDHRGQPGVGDDRDGHAGVRRQVADVLAHLGRAGGAVQAEHVGPQRVDRGQGPADLGAEQHAPGRLHGDLDLEGDLAAGGGHGPAAGDHGRLHAQQVELGLDDEQVGPALEQAVGLHLVEVAQLGEADLAQRRRLGARADRAGHPPGVVRGREVGGHLLGHPRRRHVDLVGAVGQVVLGQRHAEGAEGVGLEHVAADLEVAGVQLGDDVGPGDGQQLVAALERIAPEVVGGEALGLQARAHAAVEDHHPLAGGLEVVAGHPAQGSGVGQPRRRPIGPAGADGGHRRRLDETAR